VIEPRCSRPYQNGRPMAPRSGTRKWAALITPMIAAAMASCSDTLSEIRPASTMEMGAVSDTPEGLYKAGKQHLAAGRLGLAVQNFRAVVAKRPESADAWNGLAIAFDHLRRYDLSQRYYERALALDPRSAQTLNNIGYSYFLQGDHARAAEYFDRAQRADSAGDMTAVIQANIALAQKEPVRQAKVDTRPVAAEPVPVECRPPDAWIEGPVNGRYMIVTNPSAGAAAELRRLTLAASEAGRTMRGEHEAADCSNVTRTVLQSLPPILLVLRSVEAGGWDGRG
jgi:tetratricopeptide (TPR) repeat protein